MFTNSFKQTLFAALAIGCAFTAVSCSKDNHDEIDDGVKINTGGIQFSLREEPFQKDIHFTRGVDMKPLSVDLDSMEAEVTLEPDTAQTKVQTRATISDGNYTIIAFRKSDGKRLDQKLTGTMSYGRFTPTGSSRNMFKWLPQDTYIFVCFNDKVTDNGNHVLTASGDGCIGRTEQTLTKRDETVKFEMKHVGARVKIQIMAYMPTPAGMKAKITDSNTTSPTGAVFDALSGSYSYTNGSYTTNEITLPAAEKKYTDSQNEQYGFVNIFGGDYTYFMPATNGSTLSLALSNINLYKRTNKSGNFPLNKVGVLQRNTSYVMTIRLLRKLKYLYHDGSVGYLKDRGTRKPVGLVVRENNGTANSGIAMAIYRVYDRRKERPYNALWWANGKYKGVQCNKQVFNAVSDAAANDMQGYRWTWEANGSVDNTIKANNPLFPPFYYAARYPAHLSSKGITLSGSLASKRWFLPSNGYFKLLGAVLGEITVPAKYPDYDDITWERHLGNAAFMQAGGDEFDQQDPWTSTQTIYYGLYKAGIISLKYGTGLYITFGDFDYPYGALPCVHF